VKPYRNVAVLNAGDIGEPSVLMFRPGSQSLPKEVLIKNTTILNDKWHRFVPSKGHLDPQGNLVTMESQQKPHMYPLNYAKAGHAIDKASKEWAVEFLGSFGPQKA